MRKEFLFKLLQEAISQEKVEEATRIKGILCNESQKKIWATIHHELNQTRSHCPTRIEVPMADGRVRECNTKEEVKQGIGDDILECFSHAASAPVCQGAIFNHLGYSANTDAALEILAGTFVPPPGTTPTTVIILDEIARIWAQMEGGEVDIVVSVKDFQHYWQRAKEKTASLFSGLHFRHYKAIAASDFLSKVHTLKLKLISKTGSAPVRWTRGLPVMQCRKLNAGHYEFSPQVKEWLDRYHAFRALLRLKSGKKVRNKGNAKRFAQRCGIPNPMQHSKK